MTDRNDAAAEFLIALDDHAVARANYRACARDSLDGLYDAVRKVADTLDVLIDARLMARSLIAPDAPIIDNRAGG